MPEKTLAVENMTLAQCARIHSLPDGGPNGADGGFRSNKRNSVCSSDTLDPRRPSGDSGTEGLWPWGLAFHW